MLDVYTSVHPDFFHSSSEHSEEKVYEVQTLFGLSSSVVSIGTGVASCKRLVQVSPIFSTSSVSFLELLCVYSNSVVP